MFLKKIHVTDLKNIKLKQHIKILKVIGKFFIFSEL